MGVMNLGWSRDETMFAIAAILLLFRPKRRPPVPQKAKKRRVSFVVEEVANQYAKGSAKER